MNRELDRQIAINFHPDCKVEESYVMIGPMKRSGCINGRLAWDTWEIAPTPPGNPGPGGDKMWTRCKDFIWATENLPHYSEDLNLAFALSIPSLWEFQIETLARGKTYKAMYYLDRDDGFDYASAIHLNPAEAICLARLKLKDDYGI